MQQETPNPGTVFKHPEPYAIQLSTQGDSAPELTLENVDNPLPQGTLGDLGLATNVVGLAEFPPTILVQPFDPSGLIGIVPTSVRVFRWDSTARSLRPVWNSGINVGHGFVWTKIRRPGVYVPIGLPRDRLLHEVLRTMAYRRHYADQDSPDEMKAITASALALFLESSEKDVEESRRLLTVIEVQTGLEPIAPHEIRYGRGGYIQSFPLPHDAPLAVFREHLTMLETPSGGLPEEALFSRPELLHQRELHGTPPGQSPIARVEIDQRVLDKLPLRNRMVQAQVLPQSLAALSSPDWWMYHHDAEHTGQASGSSNISSTNVSTLHQHSPRSPIALAGPIISIPSIVQGKIYVGTGNSTNAQGGSGGTLYKIDLVSCIVENTFTFDTGAGSGQGYAGIGSSPAIVAGKVYFSGLNGNVYCLDATTLTPVWVTDLRNADPAHNQPVQNDPSTDCWSSPLVVNGKVYVGCGEGEQGAFGFVYCLDATTGKVLWLFCTNQFSPPADNSPNLVPNSTVGAAPLLAGFTQQADPPYAGVSVWSSCAYDRTLNRIYVGTGNSKAGDDNTLPDKYYGSGVLALDADTGEFKGFFQPSPSDSYRETLDTDVDIPASPLLFTRSDGKRVLAIGSKNGSFFLLDAATMTPLTRRQLLPYDANGKPLPQVDPHVGLNENKSGVFGTAALHQGLGRLFVGIGGYGGAIDSTTTPFMRALDWNTLNDAWPTVVGADGVTRYTAPSPPMYTAAGEAGLSSPAVVNDVVFVSTTKPGLYALDAATGHSLWFDRDLPVTPRASYLLGPAIYGDYVVIGAGNKLNIYSL
jgi:outer membrane protein assembly factor BamB